jgi:MYXO-CTERM domain-containing protein
MGLVVVALVVPAGADAYTLRTTDAGIPLHWANTDVPFRVDGSLGRTGDPQAVASVVDESLAAWGGLPASQFLFSGDSQPVASCEPGPSDGVSDIVLTDDEWPYDPSFAGVTLVTYDVASGEIQDADIFLNGEAFEFEVDGDGDCFDVGNVLTHELGHALGLGHSDDPEATMYAISRRGETAKRSLADDDLAAFDQLYGTGADAFDSQVMPACSASPGARPPSAVSLGALVLGLGLVGRLRRRRQTRAGSRRIAIAAGLLVLAGVVSAGWAAVGRYLPAEELARRADVVFQGTVQSRQAHWAGRVIVTDVTVSVDECWAGRCGSSSRVVRELGGEVDGVGMLAPEPSALPVGAQVVLFARDVRGALALVGGAQAVFRLDPQADLALRSVASQTDRPALEPLERVRLRDLRSVVRTVLPERPRGNP